MTLRQAVIQLMNEIDEIIKHDEGGRVRVEGEINMSTLLLVASLLKEE